MKKELINKTSILEKVFWMLLFLSFLRPYWFSNNSSVELVLNALRIAVVLYTLGYVFFLKKEMNLFFLFVCLFCFCVVVTTFAYSGDMYRALLLAVCSLGGVSVVWLSYQVHKDLSIVFSSLLPVLEVLICANLVCFFAFPNGMGVHVTETGWISNQVWLFGLRNASVAYLIFGCVVSYVYYSCVKTEFAKIRFLLMLVISFANVYVMKLGGGIIGIVCMVALIAFSKVYSKRISFIAVVILFALFFIIITNVDVSGILSQFAEMLGKTSNTLSVRYNVWTEVWEKVWQKPFFGYGYQRNEELTWLLRIASGASTSHNTYLDVLFVGGGVAFCVFFIVQLLVADRYKESCLTSNIANCAVICFVSYFVVAQSEGHLPAPTMYMLMGVLWILPDHCKNKCMLDKEPKDEKCVFGRV